MKIERNDPCPCGSGKKYKRCCLRKEVVALNRSSDSDFENLLKCFKEYKQLDLISFIGGLQLCPENHSHTVRLEFAAKVACSFRHNGKNCIDYNHMREVFAKFLDVESPSGSAEDPPENLYTENIVFHGGNYIVYPGIYEHTSFVLDRLLFTIFQGSGSFSDEFKDDIRSSAMAMLSLSNEVANRMGHTRYMVSPDTWHEDIYVPTPSDCAKISAAVRFEKKELNDLLAAWGCNQDHLNPFVFRVCGKELTGRDVLKNVLLMKPLIEVSDYIVAILPGSITDALRHYIWVTAKKFGIHTDLAEKYRETVARNVDRYFIHMSFEPIEGKMPELDKTLPIEENVYRIDEDKLTYTLLVSDDASDYVDDEPNGIWNLETIRDDITNRVKSVVQLLQSDKQICCHEVLVIVIVNGIGRYCIFSLTSLPDNARCILMSAENMEVMHKLRECDNLTLWKYAIAREKLRKTADITSFSFLDEYAIYVDNGRSFCLSDEKLPHRMILTSGSGRSIRIRAQRIHDSHAAKWRNPPSYIKVCRRYKEENFPIYVAEEGFGVTFEQLVEGYAQPLWVSTKDEIRKIPRKLRRIYFEFIGMLTYWLWQMTGDLKTHLLPLGGEPIHILLLLKDPCKWLTPEGASLKFEESDIEGIASWPNRRILLKLPASIQSLLQRPDNEGERKVLDVLLFVFSNMLAACGSENGLTSAARADILAVHAPLGAKKMISLVSGETNAALNPSNLPRLRLIQEHDLEEQLDGIVSDLGERAPGIGEVVSKGDRTDLINNVVVAYYKRYKSIVSVFDRYSLLERLICLNEAICHYRATMKFNIPMRVACFTNNLEEASILTKEISKVDATALAVRTMIEVVAAEPPSGSRKINTDTLDRLIAILFHLINWAMVSDHIHLDIFDHKISILSSGRIGVKKERLEGLWDPFLYAKTLENIDATVMEYQRQLLAKDQPETDKLDLHEFEAAFKAEFALTMTQIVRFHSALTLLGFEQNTAAPRLPFSELLNEIKKILNWRNEEIRGAVQLFSLKPRKKWLEAPAGFEERDIWPWRYNRRLSYVRRPLIVTNDALDDSIVYWGPRHVDAGARELINLVTTGRFKIDEDTTDEMKELLGTINNLSARNFVSEVRDWLKEKTDWTIDTEVSVKPGGKVDAPEDLGDIDVLAIDESSRRIHSIECKNINYGRNPREIAHEIEKFLGVKDKDHLWIQKHMKRHEWLKRNIDAIVARYGRQQDSYELSSMIVTSAEIPATFVRSMPLPCFAFSHLKREGVIITDDSRT